VSRLAANLPEAAVPPSPDRAHEVCRPGETLARVTVELVPGADVEPCRLEKVSVDIELLLT
jgi:hypothetical protein